MSIESPLPNQLLQSHVNGDVLRTLPGMEEARRVQQTLFPRELPAIAGWEFAALCRPARLVGGDYCDVFEVAPGVVALSVGDVSGKGLGPALVMAYLHALVRARLSPAPGRLPGFAAELNRYLLAVLPEGMFVTLFLGLLETDTGRLEYVNAGHPPALLLSGPEASPTRLGDGGTLLGILPGAAYEAGQVILPAGGLLAVFSDGLTEAHNRTGEMFRERRVVETLRGARACSAAAGVAALLAAVEEFQAGLGQEDDQSLLIVARG
jgi:sigma-B regulation protein RsbU (phosphoserine phosphatase)